MYFGSVKFFKHLIYTVVIGFFAAAIGLAIFFGVKYGIEVNKNKELSMPADVQPQESEDTSMEQFYLHMAAAGYTPEDILNFLSENESDALNVFVEGYIRDNFDKFNLAASAEDVSSGSGSSAIEYTSLYPDLYADAPTESIIEDNVIYLTFDDGPSKNTLDILNILDKYDIKATFFMCGGDDEQTVEIMEQVAQRGHTIGIHSISHNYETVYSSVESFLEDMNNTYMTIYNATGVKPQIMRFAGGSINNYNRLVYPQIIAEVTRRGFVYYDWNVSGEDATSHATWTSIYNNILNGIENNTSDRAIILLHDSEDKYTTVTTVEDIIKALINQGYTFKALDNSVKPITFSYVD